MFFWLPPLCLLYCPLHLLECESVVRIKDCEVVENCQAHISSYSIVTLCMPTFILVLIHDNSGILGCEISDISLMPFERIIDMHLILNFEFLFYYYYYCSFFSPWYYKLSSVHLFIAALQSDL